MNIDECCYGKEPAASQLAALRAEVERLGKERDAAIAERDRLFREPQEEVETTGPVTRLQSYDPDDPYRVGS